MAGVQLAQPTFVTGPLDNLATADVYKQLNTQNPINSIQDLTKNLNPDLQKALLGGPQAIAKLPVVAFKKGKLTFNAENLGARLALAAGPLMGNLRSMVGNTISQVSSALANAIPPGVIQAANQMVNDTVAVVNGVEKQVDTMAIGALSNVGSVINSISGTDTFKVIDKGALASVYSGVINEAAKYGVPNAYGAVMGSVNDPEMKRKVAGQCLPGIVSASDVQSLKTLSQSAPAGTITAIQPTIIQDFSASYTSPFDSSFPSQKSQYSDTMDAFRSVDSQWDMGIRNTSAGQEQVTDITQLQGGSTDFHQMVMAGSQASADGSNDKLYQLAQHYPATDVESELRTSFPSTVIDPSQRTAPNTIDPRLSEFVKNNPTSTSTSSSQNYTATTTSVTSGDTTNWTMNITSNTSTSSSDGAVTVSSASNPPPNLDPRLAEFAKDHPDAEIISGPTPPVYDYPSVRTWSMAETRAVRSANQKLGTDAKKVDTATLQKAWKDGTLTDVEFLAVTKYRIN